MKKIIALLLALVMVLGLVACASTSDANTDDTQSNNEDVNNENAGNDEDTDAPDNTETPDEGESNDVVPTKVALITDVGTIDDESFNQATWQGVVEFCEANGVEYNYYQPVEGSDDARMASITTAVADGYNVIAMPGYLFGSILGQAQELYPDVYYVAIDVGATDLAEGATVGPRTVCVTFAEEQAGYLAGYAVVKDGYTKLGFLGGLAVPAVIRYGYGFIQGAEAAAAELGVEVEMKYTYGGTFSVDPAVTAKMEGWYADGTEIVFACGGGIYGSALEAGLQYNGMLVGVDVDQHPIGNDEKYAYNPFVTSAMKGLQNITVSLLTDLFAGNFDQYAGQILNMSLQSSTEREYVGLPTDAESWGFSTFTVEEYEAAVAGIRDGSIVVSNDTENLPETTYVNVIEIA